ncbi:MAG: endonuclease [Marinilabiliaceae bacterium]|nr:endonuclease [Marinilabiliaceae bacterium]
MRNSFKNIGKQPKECRQDKSCFNFKLPLYWLSIIFFAIIFFSYKIAPSSTENKHSQKDTIVGIMFYNVENLFDVYKDSLKNDEEFLPSGSRRWTYKRMKEKFTNFNRVILNAGGWNPPVIIGLCEVENAWVLNALLRETGLYGLGYRYIHYDSPDNRGIDAAMLYKRDCFNVIESRPFEVVLGKEERPTRDILYVKGTLFQRDTLHILVNHWPSRWGGTLASEPRRIDAAKVAKSICDSLMMHLNNPKIILMGDFNDDPDSYVMSKILGAGKKDDTLKFVNLALHAEGAQGTIKYQHTWSIFDQMIVSRALLNDTANIRINKPVQRIVSLPFLFESDPVYGGQRLFRTYYGFKYTGGFSDHLPVWIDLYVNLLD